MIVKNEEKVLSRCLKSVKKLVDEIIIVDTGSTDNTKEIAKLFTNKIYDFVWCEDFSKARNFAFSKATSNYIMWLDADDVVPKATVKALINLKPNFIADTYMLKYNIAFDSNGKPTFSYYRERIVRNCSLARWNGIVHECITPFGKIERLKIAINHKKIDHNNSNRNLKIYEKTLKSRSLTAREQYYYGRELYDHKKYNKCIKILTNFVNRKDSWKENVIDALYLIANCYIFLNKQDLALNTLFKTFSYDKPRANICCKIGDYFLLNKNYETAIYWYTQATKCNDVTHKGGFVEPIYYNYYPHLQLCLCYYHLNNIPFAINHNQKAGKYLNSDVVKHNNEFFIKLIND